MNGGVDPLEGVRFGRLVAGLGAVVLKSSFVGTGHGVVGHFWMGPPDGENGRFEVLEDIEVVVLPGLGHYGRRESLVQHCRSVGLLGGGARVSFSSHGAPDRGADRRAVGALVKER